MIKEPELSEEELAELIASIDVTELMKECFKQRHFDFIVDTDLGRHFKQEEALKILTDTTTKEFLYGGAAGGAKSWTGCSWLMFMCLNYPGTRWFIGREELKRVTDSTLITFYKVADEYQIPKHLWNFNAQKNYIRFTNGSRIDLLELKYQPRDPLFERFGSTEYTGGWIEEGGEIVFGAYDVLKSRVGRQHNDKYGLIGKVFITANPKKNWLYTDFYLPHKAGKLPPDQVYLTALVHDNPHVDSGYIEQLHRIKDKSQLERLLHGNWEYDDDPTAMCKYDDIISIYHNSHAYEPAADKFIIADVARFGSDAARVVVFKGWSVIEHHSFTISATTEIQECINAMRIKHGVPNKNCLADQDGVGGGVVDNCKIVGFVNNAKPFQPKEKKENANKSKEEKQENYQNLQTQCVYYLARMINEHKFYIACDMPAKDQQDINTELSWMKTYKSDDERKLRALPKEIIKENIGHSPDWRDVFLMRAYFDLNQNNFFLF